MMQPAAAFLLLAAIAANADIAAPVQVESYRRDGYVRTVIVAPHRQAYRASLADDLLTIEFDEAIIGDLAEPVAAAPDLFLAARHGDEATTLQFTVAPGARMHVSQSMNVIAIDVVPAGSDAAPRDIISWREMAAERAASFFATRTPSLKPDRRVAKPVMTLAPLQLATPAFSDRFDLAFRQHQRRVDEDGFAAAEESVLGAIAAATAETKQFAVYDAALFYMAFALDAEALAVMRDYADREEAGPFAMLAGIASIRIDRHSDALRYLRAGPDAARPQRAAWRAIAYASLGAWRDAAADFSVAKPDFSGFQPYFSDYVLAKAETLIEAGEADGAAAALRSLQGLELSPAKRSMRGFLEARISQARGDRENALNLYDLVARQGSDAANHRARVAAIALRRASGRIPPDIAMKELQSISLDWRGGLVELDVLAAMAATAEAEHDYEQAFVLRNRLIADYAGADAAGRAEKAQRRTLMAVADAAAMSPMALAKTFYDNVQYAPPGAEGDALIRKVAGDLRALDLLGESAELLEHQVFQRLKGADRAAAAATLAAVYLENDEPDETLRVLRSTRYARLPESVAVNRKMLEATALIRKRKYPEALAFLDGDESAGAARLRGDIAWARMAWRDAANAYAGALEAGEAAQNRNDLVKAVAGYVLAGETARARSIADAYAGTEAAEKELGEALQRLTAESFSGDVESYLDALATEFGLPGAAT